MVGGPLHGTLETVDGYWPFVLKKVGTNFVGYQLRYAVVLHRAVVPFTPLIYLCEDLKGHNALRIAEAYFELHASDGGLLADYALTQVSGDWGSSRKS